MSVTVKPFPTEATIRQDAEGYRVRFERYFHHPIQRVWEAISDPDKISVWLANADLFELKKDGRINLDFTPNQCNVEGKITRLEPPFLLEYTWNSHGNPPSIVRWEIYPDGKTACRLILTHTLQELNLSTASAWQVFLGYLLATLDGKQTSHTWSETTWEAVHAEYVHRYGA